MITKIMEKATHVFINTTEGFTTIKKRPTKNEIYEVFTTVELTANMADEINLAFGDRLEVREVNFVKKYMLIKAKKGYGYKDVVEAVKWIFYGE